MTRQAHRVLYVEGNVDGTIGGSYYSLLYLIQGLDRTQFDPIVVFASDNAMIPRFRDAGAQVYLRKPPTPTSISGLARPIAKALNFLRGLVLEPLRIAATLRRDRVAIVHLNNTINRNHPWMIAARIAGVPCITHERGINSEFLPRAKVFARRLSAIVCISRAVHDNFLAHKLGNLALVTIHNGLDPSQMQVTKAPGAILDEFGLPGGTRLVGIVGNIKHWKGQEVVIRAIAQLRARHSNVACLLIGDMSPEHAQYDNHIRNLITELGLTDRVIVTGFRSDVANYVNALEILVHASIQPEPFGRVLLEGMALRKPIVASDGGAVPEIVVDGETGFLFEPGDAEMLARRLETLLADPTLAARLGHAGQRRLEAGFSVQSNARETQKLYRSILSID